MSQETPSLGDDSTMAGYLNLVTQLGGIWKAITPKT